MVTTATAHRPRGWRGLRTIPQGIDPEAPAMVYLVAHGGRQALRVGVVGESARGLDELESFGWRVVTTWWFELGYDAVEVEERLLDRWRNLFSLRPRLDPLDAFDGDATTTVRSSPMTEVDATRFVDQLCRDLAGGDDEVDSGDVDDDGDRRSFAAPDPWLLAG